MGQLKTIDAAWDLEHRARREGWPYQCDGSLEFERPELNALRDLWRSLAQDKPAPSRADFDARTLKPYLRHIMIIERVPVGAGHWRYRTRLAGMALAEKIGDPTGKLLEEQLPLEFVPRWTAACDAALEGGQPLRIVGDFELPQLALLRGEILVAPLTDPDGKLTMIFVCIYFAPKPSIKRVFS